ncbi:hypothetical protein DFH07DRAFT_778652 [Mycena maculata]|uniref:Uncharacterized protein n=1 Tax=Mycena maculata TaxID=230809 RepID=A0AAD7IBX5_9AGAR|nr:hypothetical protein DFH07DRAFT_778652 [Mycena maculata]
MDGIYFPPTKVLLATDLCHPEQLEVLRVNLCADEVVLITLDSRSGPSNIRDTGELAAAEKGPRLKTLSDKINEDPMVLFDDLIQLRLITITELAKQKALYLDCRASEEEISYKMRFWGILDKKDASERDSDTEGYQKCLALSRVGESYQKFVSKLQSDSQYPSERLPTILTSTEFTDSIPSSRTHTRERILPRRLEPGPDIFGGAPPDVRSKGGLLPPVVDEDKDHQCGHADDCGSGGGHLFSAGAGGEQRGGECVTEASPAATVESAEGASSASESASASTGQGRVGAVPR